MVFSKSRNSPRVQAEAVCDVCRGRFEQVYYNEKRCSKDCKQKAKAALSENRYAERWKTDQSYREKARARQRLYYAKQREARIACGAARSRKKYCGSCVNTPNVGRLRDCRDCYTLYRQQYYIANKEYILNKMVLWRTLNRDKHRDYTKRWTLANPERLKLAAYKRYHGPELGPVRMALEDLRKSLKEQRK